MDGFKPKSGKLKLKVRTKLPAALLDGVGTTVTKDGLTYRIDLDYSQLNEAGTFDPQYVEVAIWNPHTNEWARVSLTDFVNGSIPGFDALSPTTTRGDLIFRNATTNTRLAAGTAGYLLQANGAGADPSYAGFLQSGTGAVTRPWRDKARDSVHVKDFGAVGDGVADDTAAIQNAINAVAAAGGGLVVFPRGTFLINTITLTPGVALKGGDKNTTRLLAGSNSINMLNYLVSGTTKENFSVTDIGFENNGHTGVQAIVIDGGSTALRANRVLLERLEFLGAFAGGIFLKYCANVRVYAATAFGVVNSFVLNNCSDSDLVSCEAQTFPGGTTEVGFWIIGGPGAFDEGVRLISCNTNGPGIGLVIDGQEWGSAAGCSFSTCASGALLMQNTCTNWKFAGCDFSPAGGATNACAQLSASCSEIVFSGCQFVLGSFGIVLRGARIIVSGCGFHHNSNVDIFIDAGTKSVIAGNTCDSTGVVQSIFENTGSDFNNIQSNVTNGTVNKIGVNSVAANNIVY